MNTNFMNGMFGKIAPGMCRLSMSGGIAVKTGNGYKSYNMKTGRLTNCDSFVFNATEDFFFAIPTNKVEVGDIILISGKPKCVIGVERTLLSILFCPSATSSWAIHIFTVRSYPCSVMTSSPVRRAWAI